MCGSPNVFNVADRSLKLFLPFFLPTTVFSFLKKSQVILEKGGFTPVLQNNTEVNFVLSRAFVDERQRLVRWLSNQASSFKVGHIKVF